MTLSISNFTLFLIPSSVFVSSCVFCEFGSSLSFLWSGFYPFVSQLLISSIHPSFQPLSCLLCSSFVVSIFLSFLDKIILHLCQLSGPWQTFQEPSTDVWQMRKCIPLLTPNVNRLWPAVLMSTENTTFSTSTFISLVVSVRWSKIPVIEPKVLPNSYRSGSFLLFTS